MLVMQLNLLALNVSLTLSESYHHCPCLAAMHTSVVVDMSAIKTDVHSAKIDGTRRHYIPTSENQLERQIDGRKNAGVGKMTGRNWRFICV